MLGCKPEGHHTEQHDIVFAIAENFINTETQAKAFAQKVWPSVKKIHIDAYREVQNVEGYRINLVPRRKKKRGDKQLFFINLGGYKPGVFEEFHYKILVVATNMGEAKRMAKDSSFCLQHPATSSSNHPHVDDEYGIDVDDVYKVDDILPEHLKKKYMISISNVPFTDLKQDPISNGYQLYEKLKKNKPKSKKRKISAEEEIDTHAKEFGEWPK